jgi:hypothetical protein
MGIVTTLSTPIMLKKSFSFSDKKAKKAVSEAALTTGD